LFLTQEQALLEAAALAGKRGLRLIARLYLMHCEFYRARPALTMIS
jgi:hypothetical protein